MMAGLLPLRVMVGAVVAGVVEAAFASSRYGAMRAFKPPEASPRSGQLAKLMIDINSGGDREAPTSAKPLRRIWP